VRSRSKTVQYLTPLRLVILSLINSKLCQKLTELGEELKGCPDAPLAGLQGVGGLVPGPNEGGHSVPVHALVAESVPVGHGRTDPLFHGATMHPLGGIIVTEAKRVFRIGPRAVLDPGDPCKSFLSNSGALSKTHFSHFTWEELIRVGDRRLPSSVSLLPLLVLSVHGAEPSEGGLRAPPLLATTFIVASRYAKLTVRPLSARLLNANLTPPDTECVQGAQSRVSPLHHVQPLIPPSLRRCVCSERGANTEVFPLGELSASSFNNFRAFFSLMYKSLFFTEFLDIVFSLYCSGEKDVGSTL
jgi:hypothetical protein